LKSNKEFHQEKSKISLFHSYEPLEIQAEAHPLDIKKRA